MKTALSLHGDTLEGVLYAESGLTETDDCDVYCALLKNAPFAAFRIFVYQTQVALKVLSVCYDLDCQDPTLHTTTTQPRDRSESQ